MTQEEIRNAAWDAQEGQIFITMSSAFENGFEQGIKFMQEHMQRKLDQANEDGELLAYNCENRVRKEMVEKACKLLCKTCNITSGGAILKECNYKPCYRYNGFRKAMLNENK